jgi:hypothetical protein
MLKSISSAFIFRLLNALVLAFGTPILLVRYGEVYFSQFAIISFVLVSIPIFDGGLTRRTMRELNRSSAADYKIVENTASNSVLILSCFIFFGLLLSLDIITNSTPLLDMTTGEKLLFCFSAQVSYYGVFLRGLMEIKFKYATLGIVRLIHNIVFILIFLVTQDFNKIYLFIAILKSIELLAYIYFSLQILTYKFSLGDGMRYILGSRYFAVLSIIPVFLANVEKFTLTNSFPSHASSMISVSEIVLKFTMLSGAISGVMYNYFSKDRYSSKEKVRIIYLVLFINTMIYAIILLIGIFLEHKIIVFLNLDDALQVKEIILTYFMISFFTAITLPLVAFNTVNGLEKKIGNFYLVQLIFLSGFLLIVSDIYVLLFGLLLRVLVDTAYQLFLSAKHA